MASFPWTGEPIPASDEAIYAAYPSYRECGLARFGPDKVVYSADVLPILEQLYQTPLHSDDLWIITNPKCGTTWMSELAWLVNHDCDFAGAESHLTPDRAHFLDMPVIMSAGRRQMMTAAKSPMLKPITERPRPWHIQTHLPLNFLPPALLDTCKVIYVARNPKDAAVSFYKMLQMNGTVNPELTTDQFAEMYMSDRCISTPFFSNVLQAWRQRENPNMLFVTFEEMKQDLRSVINRVAEHLGKKLTEQQVDQLEKHCSFETMKENKFVNKENLGYHKPDKGHAFMRKGQTGDWKNNLSPEVSQKMDAWMEENQKGTGLQLITELPSK